MDPLAVIQSRHSQHEYVEDWRNPPILKEDSRQFCGIMLGSKGKSYLLPTDWVGKAMFGIGRQTENSTT